MLADEICKDGIFDYDRRRMDPVIESIATAQKYTLAPQFAAVADKLAEDFSSLVKAFPFCRLPYPKVWIEVLHLDRPKFATSAIQAPRFQTQPKRVGFLCTATRKDLSAWKTHLFWSISRHDRPGINAAAFALQCDMTYPIGHVDKSELDKRDNYAKEFDSEFFGKIEPHPGWRHSTDAIKMMMMNHTNVVTSDYGMPVPYGVSLDKVKDFYKVVTQLARSDWAGEAAYLLSVIGLMNARNAAETLPANYAKLNKARIKRNDKPLFEHYVLKIHSRIQQRVASTGKGGDHSAMRGHFVRGHFKTRKNGIFFWHPFARGDFTKGRIHKDYELHD
jgi:hypothetical protein